MGALLIAGTVYAFFTTVAPTQVATAKTGLVHVELREDFPTTDAFGAPIDTVKTFTGENTGDSMAYVRARVFASPEYHFIGQDASGHTVDEWRPLALPASDFTITVTAPDWTDKDGFLYYNKILQPTDSTSVVTATLQLRDPSVLPEGMDIRLNMQVTLESSQATNNAYQTLFGISSMPAGVETL